MTAQRIYQDEDQQWFYSRRGEHAGPFESQSDAEKALGEYLTIRDRKLNYDLFGSSIGFMRSFLSKLAA